MCRNATLGIEFGVAIAIERGIGIGQSGAMSIDEEIATAMQHAATVIESTALYINVLLGGDCAARIIEQLSVCIKDEIVAADTAIGSRIRCVATHRQTIT